MTLIISELGTEAVLGMGPYRQKLTALSGSSKSCIRTVSQPITCSWMEPRPRTGCATTGRWLSPRTWHTQAEIIGRETLSRPS